MNGRNAATLLLVSAGYLIAVSVAVVVTVGLILAAAALPDGGAYGSFFALMRDLPAMLAIGFAWTISCALPGFVVAIVLGESRLWDRWRDYAVAGVANAGASLAIFAVAFGSPFDMPSMVAASFPGGFAGGAAYWFSVGRLVARRRHTAARDAV